MPNQPNKDRSNRGKKRRAEREAARRPGAGQPVPIRTPEGQPAVTSLAELAKAGGQVPLNIPQLMTKLGVAITERDFWMAAAVQLESQVVMLTGGGAVPSIADVADAEEEIEDIPTTIDKCPGCDVALGPEDEFIDAVHAEDCEFEGHIATAGDQAEEAAPTGTNVPDESPSSDLTEEEQAVVDEAKAGLQQAEWVENAAQALQEESPE